MTCELCFRLATCLPLQTTQEPALEAEANVRALEFILKELAKVSAVKVMDLQL